MTKENRFTRDIGKHLIYIDDAKEAIKLRDQQWIEEIEKISDVIDWENDIGEMREMKEEEWQALKSKMEAKNDIK